MADDLESRMRARVEAAKRDDAAQRAAASAQQAEVTQLRNDAVSLFGSVLVPACDAAVAAIGKAVADVPATIKCDHSLIASRGLTSVILEHQGTIMTLNFILMKDNNSISVEKSRFGSMSNLNTEAFKLSFNLRLTLANLAQLVSEAVEQFVTYSLKLKVQDITARY